MKSKLFITIFISIFCINTMMAQQQSEEYKSITIAFPPSQIPATSFYVNENKQVFLPLNGGIYMANDSLWFLPPSKEYVFTSFAPNMKDTSLFVFANSTGQSELYYLKSSIGSAIKKYSIVKLEKGLYNVIYKNDVCYVWGYSSGVSKIGILTDKEITWLLNIEGLIRQVQVNDSSEIFFAYKNSVFKLNDRETVLSFDKTIYGFAFDKNNRLLVSSSDGIGLVEDRKMKILATGILGIMEYRDKSLFVLDRRKNEITQLIVE